MFFQNVTLRLCFSARLISHANLSPDYCLMLLLLKNTLAFSSLLGALCEASCGWRFASFYFSVFSVSRWFNCIFGGCLPHHCQSEMCKMHAAGHSRISTALVPFQRHQPSQPPCKNVNSADLAELPARHFSGKSAKIAQTANQKATPTRIA